MQAFSTRVRALRVSMFLMVSGRKYWGAISKSHCGFISRTVRMQFFLVSTSSWQSTYSGRQDRMDPGWITTTCESLAVRQTLFFCRRATCVKQPDRMHFLMGTGLTLRGTSSFTKMSNFSMMVLSWSRTSKTDLRWRWLRKFLKHQSTSWFLRLYSKKAFMRVMWSPSWLMNLLWASVASIILSFGRRKMFGAFKQATIVRISLTQLYLGEVMRTLDSWGSNGNSAIFSPSAVRLPSSSRAPRQLRSSRALMRVSGAGGSMKSKCTRSLMPSFFRVKTVVARLDLRISGQVFSMSSSLQDFSVQSRKHLPALVLPARPARCLALALLMGDTSRLSTRMRGLKTFCLEKPGSMTQTIPSMVILVSAMLVATIILRPLMPFLLGLGGSSKMRCCWQGGSVLQRGMMATGPTRSPISLISSSILLQAVSISSSPVKKSRMSPSPSFSWMVTAVLMEASTQSLSGYLLKYTSTGYILPGMLRRGDPLKYSWNLTASMVADITISFRSVLLASISLIRPKSTSVLRVLSWASSRMITEYRSKLGSIMASRSSMPSVMYLRMVLLEVRSSKRMEQPTSSPNSTSSSSLTLLATDIAATLLGCVQAMPFLLVAQPASIRNCGICVVLPEPVSPTSMSTWYSWRRASNLGLESKAGNLRRVSRSWQQCWEQGLPLRQLESVLTFLEGVSCGSSSGATASFLRMKLKLKIIIVWVGYNNC